MHIIIKNYIFLYIKKYSFFTGYKVLAIVGVSFFTNRIEMGRSQKVFQGWRGIA